MVTDRYTKLKESAFATATVPDGYFGRTMEILLSMEGNRVVGICPVGYYGLGLPSMKDHKEVIYYLENHPKKYSHIKLNNIL